MVLAVLSADAPTETVSDPRKQPLLDAGIELFGERGFNGVSVRDICTKADTNVAAVSYHFGGKQDLYEACAIYIMGQIKAELGSTLDDVHAFLESGRNDPDEALELLTAMLDRVIDFLVPDSEKAAAWAPFVTRVRMDATGPKQLALQASGGALLSKLVSIACGSVGEDLQNGILAQGFIGQIQIYRINRAAALQNLGLERIGPDELPRIKAAILRHVRAQVLAARP